MRSCRRDWRKQGECLHEDPSALEGVSQAQDGRTCCVNGNSVADSCQWRDEVIACASKVIPLMRTPLHFPAYRRYKYVNIDDCWQDTERDKSGNLQPNPALFPEGMKSLSDYIHSKGLLFGMYTDSGCGQWSVRCQAEDAAGCLGCCMRASFRRVCLVFACRHSTKTCAGFPGSIDNEERDAQQFASWGVDFLKARQRARNKAHVLAAWSVVLRHRQPYASHLPDLIHTCGRHRWRLSVQVDNCNSPPLPTSPQMRYRKMRDAILATGRDIFFSICEWGWLWPSGWASQLGNRRARDWATARGLASSRRAVGIVPSHAARFWYVLPSAGAQRPTSLSAGRSSWT